MLIVPYIVRNPLTSLLDWKLTPVTLFLENRGKSVCKDDSPKEWLELNGIHYDEMWQEKDTVFVKVNTEKTNMSEFYSFEQLTKVQTKGTEECWRTFFVMNEKTWDSIPEPIFSNLLQKILSRKL